MKVAICFSGQIRDMSKSLEYWKDIIQKYNIDVYGSFWETDDDSKHLFNQLNPKSVEYEDFDLFQSTINVFNQEFSIPVSVSPSEEKNIHHRVVNWGLAPNDIDYFEKNNILSMWYKVWRANMISKKENYDVVIRTRTDLYFDELEIEKNDYLNIPWGWRQNSYWENCGGLIDAFAYGSSKIMYYYSSVFLYLTRYLKENQYFFPAENLFKSHLCQKEINIRILPIRLFFQRDGECFNQARGVVNYEYKNSKDLINKPDINYTFYKNNE